MIYYSKREMLILAAISAVFGLWLGLAVARDQANAEGAPRYEAESESTQGRAPRYKIVAASGEGNIEREINALASQGCEPLMTSGNSSETVWLMKCP